MTVEIQKILQDCIAYLDTQIKEKTYFASAEKSVFEYNNPIFQTEKPIIGENNPIIQKEKLTVDKFLVLLRYNGYLIVHLLRRVYYV